jgi:hypothetical protein
MIANGGARETKACHSGSRLHILQAPDPEFGETWPKDRPDSGIFWCYARICPVWFYCGNAARFLQNFLSGRIAVETKNAHL